MANVVGKSRKKSAKSKRRKKKTDRTIKSKIKAVQKPKFSYLTLRNNTPKNIVDNSKNPKCKQMFLGKVVKKTTGRVSYVWRTGCSGRPHISVIEVKPGKRPQSSKINVLCSCEYFMYTLEVVLTQAGLSENKYALPQWPKVRNPSGLKHLCKHLYRAGLDMVRLAMGDMEQEGKIKKQRMSQGKVDNTMDNAFSKSRQMKQALSGKSEKIKPKKKR